jgi:DNA-binding transcriptional MerR regulator
MNLLDSFEIPDKAEFKIGEVAKLLDLEPYVLRYWEDEFERLDPEKTDTGQRVYGRGDIELLIRIRHLLYTEKFTIKGARRQFELAEEGESPILGNVVDFAQQNLFNTDSSGEDDGERPGDEETREQLEQLRKERNELQTRVKNLKDEVETLRRNQTNTPNTSREVPEKVHDLINCLDSDINDLESISA